MPSINEKKRIEAWILDAARKAGIPIPLGEVAGEEPDFRFPSEAIPLGIELSELLRPASSNHGIMPVEEESFHKDLVRIAEENYYRTSDAKSIKVSVYFRSAAGQRRDKRQMADALTAFVRSKLDQAKPFKAFRQFEVPEGFSVITILAERDDWSSGEGGVVTYSDIQPTVAERINAKTKLIQSYRKNLPPGAQIWLLLYTTPSVPRNLPIPFGVLDWKFRFDFDRVFWFDTWDGFVEINREMADQDFVR